MREEAEIISGPNRKMSMASATAAESKPEQNKELSEIRKEVIEARNLVIKTDSLLKNLHAEVKAIGKRHEDLQKKAWISSGVAYAIFAALCVAGAVVVTSARSSNAGAERERLEKTVAELTQQQRARTPGFEHRFAQLVLTLFLAQIHPLGWRLLL